MTKLIPDTWYLGKVVEVHPHWSWLRIQTNVNGKDETFTFAPAYKAVKLEVTVEGKKEVRFQVDSEDKLKAVQGTNWVTVTI